MKKLLLALALALAPCAAFAQGGLIGPPNQILCNRTAILSPTSVNSVFSLTKAVSGTNIFVCGWHFTTQSVATTQSFMLLAGPQNNVPCTAGTGSSGATSLTLTPSINVSGTAPSADHIDYATISTSVTNQQLCVGVQNGTNLSGIVYFSQF